MADFSPVELAIIAHACEDHAGQWYRNPLVGGSISSTCRYVSEGNLGKLCDRYSLSEVWAAVREYLDAHPEILAAGPSSNTDRAERQAARDAAARALLDEAHVVFDDGRYAEALDLVERAELKSPGFERWDIYRRIIEAKIAGREPETAQGR